MNVLVFDIETVPDVDGGRRLYGLDGLSDHDVAEAMFFKRRQESGREFLRLHLQRIVAISVVLRIDERCKVWSIGDPESSEDELVRRFFDGVERYTPTLVTWNGGAFDLPVLNYRALMHGIQATGFWEMGEQKSTFRWNNYISRFHWRHIDLMDVLSGYQIRGAAPLDEIAVLLGLPGKMGMNGAKVWDCFQEGDLVSIRNYCETDVLNTYLVYLGFERMRGRLTLSEYQREARVLREVLSEANQPHFDEFVRIWSQA